MPSTQQERGTPRARFGAQALLALVAVLLVAVPFAIVVVLVTSSWAPLQRLDNGTAGRLHGFAMHHSAFTHAMKLVSAVGSPIGWWLVLTPVFVWLLYRRLPRLALFVAVTAIGSSLLNNVIKTTVDRARPHLTDPVAVAAGKSFPSGHTQAAVAGCGILVLVFLPVVDRRRRRWMYLLAGVVVGVIGFSRIALGVHYLSDVLGAIFVGTAWVLAMTAAFSAWRREEHEPAARHGEGLEPEQRDRIAPGDAEDAPRE